MGQSGLTSKQELIFTILSSDSYFTSNFYFTGGTALSAFYLHHRQSDDLDFFSEKQFNEESITSKLTAFSQNYAFKFTFTQVDNVTIYILRFPDNEELKVDFVFQPFKRLDKGEIIQSFYIDSLTDIAVNKLLAIRQRKTAKDFVDLYFLLKQYSLWDLRTGLEKKFNIETDDFILALDLDKAEELENLPKMLKPLTLVELKEFFREQAKTLAKMVVE